MLDMTPGAAHAPFSIPLRPTEDELLAKYFRVLADRVRLRILEALDGEGELSVGELVDRIGIAQPSVSNHLACLPGFDSSAGISAGLSPVLAF